MTQKLALLRLVSLLVAWLAASATGTLVFAQAGSTGGTVGKTNKSLSEGEDNTSSAQSSTKRSHTNGRGTKSESEHKHGKF